MIDCKGLAKDIFERAKTLSQKFHFEEAKVVIINASEDESSKKYVELKENKFKDAGFITEIKSLTTFEEVKATIEAGNKDKKTVGIIVQLPLFKDLEPQRNEILNLINFKKDIDCLTDRNLEKIGTDDELVLPATVEGICILLEQIASNEKQKLSEFLQGKKVAIVNDSKLIGIPLAKKLSSRGAVVQNLNKFTEDIKSITFDADIVVTATGNIEIFDSSFFKNDSILIDVTSLKTENGTKGDIKADEELKSKVKFITPVPGGVGPLTVSTLILNTVKLAIFQS